MSQGQFVSLCTADAMARAAQDLMAGSLVAFPTETVYGLGADATNAEAVSRIYRVKGRPADHPLIVHLADMQDISEWAAEIPDYAISLARTFWPGPMTLIFQRSALAQDFITGGQETVGLRVPDHTLALALLQEFKKIGGKGLAAPSANRFGQLSHSAGRFTVNGDNQNTVLQARRSTANATPTDLTLNGNAPDGTTRLTVAASQRLYGRVIIQAVQNGGSNFAAFERQFTIGRAGSGDVTLAAVNTIGTDFNTPGWAVALGADTTNQALTITVTGAADTTIRWHAVLYVSELTHG
jgi:tRNA threonylcarbamoyl adenosine modification protein (Sua5/YciO/YrdC/YwlC family)